MKNKGSVLIAALWLIIFFSGALMVIGVRMRSEIFIIKKITQKSHLGITSYSGVSVVRQIVTQYFDSLDPQVTDPKLFSENWFGNSPYFQKTDFGQDSVLQVGHYSNQSSEKSPTFVTGLLDEAEKINVNTAPEELLKTVYLADNILSESAAENLAKATILWRQRQVTFSEFGHAMPKNKTEIGLGSLDEMLVIPGMPQALWLKIKDSLTVYGSGKVNLNTAPKETLVLMGLGDLAGRILTYRQSVKCGDSLHCQSAFLDLADLTLKIGTNSEENSKLQNLSGFWTFSPDTVHFISRAQSKNPKWGSASTECIIDKKGRILFLKEV